MVGHGFCKGSELVLAHPQGVFCGNPFGYVGASNKDTGDIAVALSYRLEYEINEACRGWRTTNRL